MRPSLPFRDPLAFLRSIRESIQLIDEFVAGMDLAGYVEDTKTQAAVERKMQVISEAAIRLKDDADVLCPGVPWRDIRGIGNWLRHEYDRVDLETVWNTIQDDLPPLKIAVEKALAAAKP
jgi:uncharacterized protein with HEPN domain